MAETPLDESSVPLDPGPSDESTGQKGGVRAWIGWLTRRPTTFGGLAVGTVFFWISLTPSLLPRPWFTQGAVSGISLAIGYGVGSGLSALIRRVLPSEPSARIKGIAWRVLLGAVVLGSALLVWSSKHWQNELRRLMGIDDEPGFSVLGLLVLTLFVSALVLLGARLVRSFARFTIRQVDRLLPRTISRAVGLVVVIAILIGLWSGVLWRGAISGMNSMAGSVNGTTTDGTEQPTSDLRSGGPESLIEWDDLGRMGRDFVGRGPDLDDLEDFHDEGCCLEPIRVYAGLDSAPTARERAQLAVQDLDRAGAFEREVIGVFSSTGTGWINPRVADSLEYLHQGDTAEVSMQYSFLPSWMSFLVDQEIAAEAGTELIGAINAHVADLPEADRPTVLLFGESLGSYATEQAFDNMADLRAASDGALLVGPTFSNPMWRELVDGRYPDSPQWLPEVDEPGVKFARTPADLEGMRDVPGSHVVYLQNSSDPITWWSKDLGYREPDWAGTPAAPDRSPAFRWYPIVTFWQVVTDLTDSLGVPTGYGHHFGSNVVDGWVAVSAPDDWTDDDTARLKAVVGERG